MSSIINRRNMTGSVAPIQDAPGSFGDIVSASIEGARNLNTARSSARLHLEVWEEQAQLYQKTTGQSTRHAFGKDTAGGGLLGGFVRVSSTLSEWDKFVEEQKKLGPTQFLSSSDMNKEAVRRAQGTQERIGRLSETVGDTTFLLGNIAGGLIGQVLYEPETVIVGGIAAKGSKTMLQAIGREAFIGGATDLAVQPAVANWQKQIGNKYTFADMATSVAFSSLISGAFAALPYALRSGIQASRTQSAQFFDAAAKSKATPKKMRSAFSKMADFARVDEATPYKEQTPRASTNHYENLNSVESNFQRKEPIDHSAIAEVDFIDEVPRTFDVENFPESTRQAALNEPTVEGFIEKARRGENDALSVNTHYNRAIARKIENLQEQIESIRSQKLRKSTKSPDKQTRKIKALQKEIDKLEKQKPRGVVRHGMAEEKALKSFWKEVRKQPKTRLEKPEDMITNKELRTKKFSESLTPEELKAKRSVERQEFEAIDETKEITLDDGTTKLVREIREEIEERNVLSESIGACLL